MSTEPALTVLEWQVRAIHYKIMLYAKLKLLAAIRNFIPVFVKYVDTHPECEFWEAVMERPRDPLIESDIARILYYMEETEFPAPLDHAIQMIDHMILEAIALEGLCSTEELQKSLYVECPYEDKIRQFLREGNFYHGALKIRKVYMRTLEIEETTVPIERSKREPDEYLEDAIQNLLDDIAQYTQ
jgi:hypothetical protein